MNYKSALLLLAIVMLFIWSGCCNETIIGAASNQSREPTHNRGGSIDHHTAPVISSYRLGDLVLLTLSDVEQMELTREHPQSIGSKYIQRRNDHRNAHHSNIDIITAVVYEHMQQSANRLPRDTSDSIVIHLRLGDVVAGNHSHEQQKRPLSVDHLKAIIAHDTTSKRYVIGNVFFAKTSSTNYEECTRSSHAYLKQVLDELQAEHIQSESADVDLCCAVKAKLFVQGRGYFSRLIVEIRNRLKLPNVETSTYDSHV